MTSPSVHAYLSQLLDEAAHCRLGALIEPARLLIEALGPRPLLEVTAWDIAEPMARAGYHIEEYRAHVRDWDSSYVAEATTPWANEESEALPHPMVVELADAGFGASGRVLELGCGVGANAAHLVDRGARVVGLDISAQAIARGHELFPDRQARLELHALNVFDFEFGERRFDYILDSWCLHHIPAHLMPSYLEHTSAALEPGGELLLLAHSPKFNRTEGLLFLSTGVIGKALRYVLTHDPESCFGRTELERLLAPIYEVAWVRHYYDFHINVDRHYSFIVHATKR